MNSIYESEAVTYAAGSTTPLRLDFIPERGPTGGRNVIKSLQIRAEFTISSTCATTVMRSADQASLLRRCIIKDGAGELVNLTGPQIRAKMFLERGLRMPVQPNIVSSSTSGSARTVVFCIDFARPNARRPWDFALPVDDLKAGGLISLQHPAASDLLQSDNAGGAGGVLGNGTDAATVIASGSYRVAAYCREEFDIEMKTRCEYRAITNASATDHHIPVNGGLLMELFCFQQSSTTASGSVAITSATDVDSPALGLNGVRYNSLLNAFLEDFPANSNGYHQLSATGAVVTQQINPFTAGTALAVVWPKLDQKINEYPRIPGELFLRLNGETVTNLEWVYGVITGRNERSAAGTLRAAGAGRGKVRIKTDSKQGRDPALFGALASQMPATVGK